MRRIYRAQGDLALQDAGDLLHGFQCLVFNLKTAATPLARELEAG